MNFSVIGVISDSVQNIYHVTQPAIYSNPGSHYFRLRLIDASGNEFFSNIEKIERVISNGNFFLFPNPATDVVYILWQGTTAPEELQVVITSINGTEVARRLVYYSDTGHPLRFDLPAELPAGVYIFKVTDTQSGNQKMQEVMVD